METEQTSPDGEQQAPRKKWGAPKVSEVGIFTVREKDYFLVKAFKTTVNYTIFGFVMFMTGLVWIITLLVI